ncbi:aspartyl-phosphate phosphatase Spo0E family protein [Virgibacillus ainsalahensis]
MEQIIVAVPSNLPTDILMKKNEMIQLGLEYGLANDRTIECSQQLDKLLNKYATETHS